MIQKTITLFVIVLSMLIAIPAVAAPNSTNDTVSKYSFRLEIEGVDAGQFSSVDGLSIEQEVIEYQNGDDPLLRKRPGRVKYGDITLTKEYAASSVLNDWIETARSGNGSYDRKNLSIIMVDQGGTELKRWNLFQSFPKSWALSTLDNGSGDKSLSETLIIVCEWFEES